MIDVHAHAVLEMTLGAAGAHGPYLDDVDGQQRFRVGGYELCGVRYRGSLFMDLDVRLAAMDAAGIDLQVLSPNPLTYFHHIPAADAVPYHRTHNDAMAELVATSPRLAGFASLPLQSIDDSIRELERSVGLGLLGPYLGTAVDLDTLDPLWEACVALDVPAFVHPAPTGIDGPLLDARTRRWDLDLLLGFAYEESLAVATLIFGGVLHRWPTLDVCVSHGGGITPFALGGWRHAAAHRPWSPDWLRTEGVFDALYRRLWLDVHVNSSASLALLREVHGDERLVFGTNLGGWDAAIEVPLDPTFVATMDANARTLLRL